MANEKRIKTGIRKDASFNENLASVRKAVADYGPSIILDRLNFMRDNFYWIKSDPSWIEWIDLIVRQIEYDSFIAPNLTREIEVSEFVAEGGAFVTRKKKIVIVDDPWFEELRPTDEEAIY